MTPTDIAAKLTLLGKQREEMAQSFNVQLAQLDLQEKSVRARREQLIESFNRQSGFFDGREETLKEMMKESAPAEPGAGPGESRPGAAPETAEP